MTTAYPPLLAALAADLQANASGYAVHVGRAPAGADALAEPYAVLATADTEAESVVSAGKVRANAPTDVVLGANVYGTLAGALTTAADIADRWLSDAVRAPLEAAGRRLFRAELAQSLALPSGDADSNTHGRRVAVRFTTLPL